MLYVATILADGIERFVERGQGREDEVVVEGVVVKLQSSIFNLSFPFGDSFLTASHQVQEAVCQENSSKQLDRQELRAPAPYRCAFCKQRTPQHNTELDAIMHGAYHVYLCDSTSNGEN